MHALHSLAHRAPPATRRVRWQPYSSSSSSSSVSSRSSPPSCYLNTPSSSVPSSPEMLPPSHDVDRPRQSSSLPPSHSKDPLVKDLNRGKHATSLVGELPKHTFNHPATPTNERPFKDQAVKSLCEIWRPQDIPLAFVASARTMISGGHACEPILSVLQKKPSPNHGRVAQQLPSPISPSTQLSPLPSVAMSSPTLACISAAPDSASMSNSRTNLVPIRAFVHEVLRRSRTSGCVLQTALCYLEALRTKVPELVQQEKSGEGVKGELDTSDRITPATEAEMKWEAELATRTMKTPHSCEDDIMATVRVHDDDLGLTSTILLTQEDDILGHEMHQRLPPAPTLPPLPPLPSPLLCPRRAFLASLILASKFTQDKCYSNRAWAKLSGLPPREIGRCERALGEALEWRLWVGKQPSALDLSPLPTMHRPVVRSQSEGSLFAVPSFLSGDEKTNAPPTSSSISANHGIRRCATLPADIYGSGVALSSWSGLSYDTHNPNHLLTNPGKTVDSYLVTVGPSQHSEKISQSPSPETPGLSYSPLSIESYSGDRTLNSSSFLDEPGNSGKAGTSLSEPWLWTDPSDCLPKTPSPHPSNSIPVTGYIHVLPPKVAHGFVATGPRIVENSLAC